MSRPVRIDLTHGSIIRGVFLFALPICIGNMLQQLYTTIDTLVVSNFCGTISLAAIGATAQPVEILLCMFMGIGAGVSILISQYTGSQDLDSLRKTVRTSTALLYLCALPMTVIGCLLGPSILKLMQTPEEAIPSACLYMNILFCGTIANMGYNISAGILRGYGDSRSSLYFLLISCLVNIVFDYFFVAILGWDVMGAGLATILAQFVSWFASAFYLRRRYPECGFTLLPRKPDSSSARAIIRVGLPLGLNYSIYSVGHVLMQFLINTQGTAFIAGCSVASRVHGLATVGLNSISSAATTFSGQNLGAGFYSRLRKGVKQIPLVSALISMTLGILIAVFARPILSLFSPEPDVEEAAVLYLQVISPFMWAYAVLNALISFLNGMGIIRYPTIVNILMLWAVRIPVAVLIQRFINGRYLMAATSISFLAGMTAMLCYFLTPGWKKAAHKDRNNVQSL